MPAIRPRQLLPFLLASLAWTASVRASETQTLIAVVGAGGAAEYEQEFSQVSDRLADAAAMAGAEFLKIGRARDPTVTDKQALRKILAAQATDGETPLWIVLVGHGTFDGEEAKFNLRGPDMTAAELGEWLKPFRRPLVVVNCASSSAPFINQLSGPGRVVISATKSGFEQNYARFGQYFAESLADLSADLDKDEQTSLLEAFLSASARTREFYEQDARLPTETALCDDNGDGRGTPAAWFRGIHPTRQPRDGAESIDGARAHQLHLIPNPVERDMPTEVRQRRDALEMEIARLRQAKDDFADPDNYYSELEPLLIEMAKLYEELP